LKIIPGSLNDWRRANPLLAEALFWSGLTLLILILFFLFLFQLYFFRVKKPIGIITTTEYCQGIITAATTKVKPGDIALSRDIGKKYGLRFGDLIYLDGEAEPYIFRDRMPPEWHQHADIYLRSCKEAEKYGVRKRKAWFVIPSCSLSTINDPIEASGRGDQFLVPFQGD
jgi:hypothetical protein